MLSLRLLRQSRGALQSACRSLTTASAAAGASIVCLDDVRAVLRLEGDTLLPYLQARSVIRMMFDKGERVGDLDAMHCHCSLPGHPLPLVCPPSTRRRPFIMPHSGPLIMPHSEAHTPGL